MRRLIVTLLAATMLLPVAAAAQERGDRPRDRGPRAEGAPGPDARPDGPGPGMGEMRQRPWRDQMQPADGSPPEPRARFDRGPGQERGARLDQRPDQRPAPRLEDGRGNDGRWNAGGRPDRGGPDRGGADRDGRDWSRGGVDTGARYGIPDRDGIEARRRDDLRPDPRNDPRRWDGRRDDDRRFGDRRFDDRRFGGGWRDDGRGDWGGNRGNTWYSDRDVGNRGGWNRGWRDDGRYDWNRYRALNRNAYRLPRYYAPSGWAGGYRRFGIGTRLSAGLWGQNYWIADPFDYRLPEAYGPYRWVRYYGDALLVDLRTGLVIDTVYDIFW